MKKIAKNKGITLIVLVITIVIMLILAGVSMNIAFGENGLITRSQKAKDETRGQIVEKEQIKWEENAKLEHGVGETYKTLAEFVAELREKDYIDDTEMGIINSTKHIKIGGIEIDFTLDFEEEI